MVRILTALTLLWSVSVCIAQQSPTRPITHIVPFEAGAVFDAFARVLSRSLQENGHPGFVVENRPGANALIGTRACVRARPDGQTVCMLARDSISLLPWETDVGYDPVKDLDPVTNMAVVQTVLVSNAALPASNFRELIDFAKKNPDKVNYTAFASGQLIMRWVRRETGAPMTFIPFKGGASAMQALLSGEIHMMFLAVGNPGLLDLIRSGKLRALAVPADERYRTLPDTPTMSEVGLPRFPLESWMGLFAPAGTPMELRRSLAKDIAGVLGNAQLREKHMAAVGLDPIGNMPDEFAKFIVTDRQGGHDLVKIVGPRTQ